MGKQWCYDDDLYLRDDLRELPQLFENCDEFARTLYNVQINKRKFINNFMNSKTREGMDIGFPTYFGQAAQDTFEDYVKYELEGKLDSIIGVDDSDEFAEYELWWCGMMYAYAHYRCRKSSVEMMQRMPLDVMRHFYVTGHQMGMEAAYEKIKAAFTGRVKKY